MVHVVLFDYPTLKSRFFLESTLAQELEHIRALKIAAADNTADGKTKCIDVKTYWRHMTYTHNVSVDVLRSVYGVKTELIERAAGGQMICMLIS